MELLHRVNNDSTLAEVPILAEQAVQVKGSEPVLNIFNDMNNFVNAATQPAGEVAADALDVTLEACPATVA
ncbi:hypothetical protein QMZ92_00585 [Streptomyces sp. HNM0645]|uniref:hypothetical protein n=1 Tax=Streptomyces sp. HNM0645 TaxID=2782343 RepID=UPI0024B66F98|nr:hypothetical protein [Streptomyces sp. HNM0645]MDI9882937.1 hypothetical protein [Streptomyces sp. HNM0645]